ncbi:response regulator [bacterium]|nr:response regulator [bacterium]
MSELILVVDDEEDLVELVAFNLERNGFQTVQALNGRDAITLAIEKLPRLIVLDLMLPDVDGLEVFRTLRKNEKTAGIPIIMLTAKADEVDRIVGLELGADDYVTKPFSPRELVLRVKGILRRSVESVATPSASLEFGPIRIDPERFEVYIEGELAVLTSTEFRLLQELMVRRGKVLTRRYLLENVWGYVHNVTDRTVDTHIKRLRQKIGPAAAAYIETIRGVGYRFADSERQPLSLDELEDTADEVDLI